MLTAAPRLLEPVYLVEIQVRSCPDCVLLKERKKEGGRERDREQTDNGSEAKWANPQMLT